MGFPEVLLEWLACCERCPADWASPDLLLLRQLARLVDLRLMLARLRLAWDRQTPRDQVGAIEVWPAESGARDTPEDDRSAD